MREGEEREGTKGDAVHSSRRRKAIVPEDVRRARMANVTFADKTIRLLFPGTLSINGNVYCSPEGTGSRARRWRSYCSISPQHLARYPSLIAFPRVLQPLACIAASILCNRTPRDLVCPPPLTVLLLPSFAATLPLVPP